MIRKIHTNSKLNLAYIDFSKSELLEVKHRFKVTCSEVMIEMDDELNVVGIDFFHTDVSAFSDLKSFTHVMNINHED